MAKKLSKTERIMQALMNGEKLSGKTILQKFGTMKGVNRINELEQRHSFVCFREWVKPRKRAKETEAYYVYSMKLEDIVRLKKILEL